MQMSHREVWRQDLREVGLGIGSSFYFSVPRRADESIEDLKKEPLTHAVPS